MTQEIFSFNVDGYIVSLIKRTTPQKSSFTGNKILHPFTTQEVRKGPKKGLFYTEEFKTSVIEDQIKETERFDVKHDGACGALLWKENTKTYEPYTRFDIKREKSGKFVYPTVIHPTTKMPIDIAANWIPCEPMPTDQDATHWPHFRSVYEDPNSYKYQIMAFDNAKKYISSMSHDDFGDLVTIEYMGSVFNQKSSDPIETKYMVKNKEISCGIVIHGTLQLSIPAELRTGAGFKKIFQAFPVIEGIIAYPKDIQPMKIRAEMYEGLSWGTTDAKFTQVYGHSGKGISNEVLI